MFSLRSRKLVSGKLSDIEDDPFIIDEKYQKKKHIYQDPSGVQDRIRIALLTSASLYLRIMKLGFPAYITDVELETTRQVNWYMAGKFFIGKFPPLMGILSTGLSRLFGYYGTEDLLYPGQRFEDFPIVALRRVSSILGACLIPLCYLTLRNMGHSRSTATFASALLVLENGIITQSRLATPEIYVLFFTALATFSWSSMHKYTPESPHTFKKSSKLWQLLTGVGMGCAISSKWTGALTFPMIWLCVITEAWYKLCDKQNNVKSVFKQICMYIITLGVLPLAIYYSMFQLHFSLVPNAGDHDMLLPSKLKYSLNGNVLEPSHPNVAYGSQIVIKHSGTVGGYLHSHKKRFTGGSKQQEVTLYPHVDVNNIWTVHKNIALWNKTEPLQMVYNKEQIRLEHVASTRKLHSHDHRPQLTNKKEHHEVTAYGDKLIQDSHDYWTLQILNDDNTPIKDRSVAWKPLTQKFRLQHIRGCMLMSHNVHYNTPQGGNHQEVTCMTSASPHLTSWIVESAYHEKMEDGEKVTFNAMTTFDKFMETQKLMMEYPNIVYNRLQTGPINEGNQKHSSEESPNKWFFKKNSVKIWSELSGHSAYLLLHPIVQKLIVGSMLAYFGYLGLHAFFIQRQIKSPGWFGLFDNILNEYYTKSVLYFFSTIIIQLQCLRFIPDHVTSMSDIIGTIYYGVGLVGVLFEASTLRIPPMARHLAMWGLLLMCFYKLNDLSRLVYGNEIMYRSECEKSGLDIDCIRFPPTRRELDIIQETNNSTLAMVYVDFAGGKSTPFRYHQGKEVEADEKIAEIVKEAFEKEAATATGTIRYHRVLPTPGLTPEAAAQWAKSVHDGALKRQKEAAEKKKKEEKKQETKEVKLEATKSKRAKVIKLIQQKLS